jgi:transposase
MWTKGGLVTFLYGAISIGGKIRSLLAMRAYSQDLRKRIIVAIEQGKTRKEVARLFNVSLSTVKRYIRQWRELGHLRPRPISGRPSKKLALLPARLLAQLEASPHATLKEHCQQWEAQEGIKVSVTTMSRAIHLLMGKQKKQYWNQILVKKYGKTARRKRKKRSSDTENAPSISAPDGHGSNLVKSKDADPQ